MIRKEEKLQGERVAEIEMGRERNLWVHMIRKEEKVEGKPYRSHEQKTEKGGERAGGDK